MAKKVLLIVTKSNWGGAQRYVYDMATNLPGYDVCAIVGGSGLLKDKLDKAGIRTISLSSLIRDIRWTSDIRAFFELIKVLRHERPDIVHLNSSKAGGLGALAARLAGVPKVIFTVHAWPFYEPISRLSAWFRWVASLATVLLCHVTICNSYFASMHTPLGLRTVTIHNGITPSDMLSRADARIKLKIDHLQGFLVGTIAELHKNKGIDVLIAAAAQTKDCTFVVLGEGEERAMLEDLIKTHHLESRFLLLGFKDNGSQYLHAFDMFILPSRTESFGMVIVEAGVAGLPVIATTVGGIPEVVEDQVTGVLVPPYDSGALADAINTLITQPNTRARMGESLREKVTRLFALRGMIKKTVEVYEA